MTISETDRRTFDSRKVYACALPIQREKQNLLDKGLSVQTDSILNNAYIINYLNYPPT